MMQKSTRLRILSYNIHKGFSWNQSKYFLSEIKEFVVAANPDLIFLQEVTGRNDRHREGGLFDAQAEFFADSLWTQFAYAKNAVYDHGHHGNLILSKYPITAWDNTNISTNSMEQRGLLVCHIEIPDMNGKKIVAACVHLDLFHRGRKKQYEMIKERILKLNANEGTPLILAGDFNDWNKKASEVMENQLGMKEIFKAKNGEYARTFPAHLPFLTLDRIYIKNCQAVSARMLTDETAVHFSDHLPLLCEVELAP